jgi:hypothetical protein
MQMQKGKLETAVREEPTHSSMLQKRSLLDPEVTDESLPTFVHALDEGGGE